MTTSQSTRLEFAISMDISEMLAEAILAVSSGTEHAIEVFARPTALELGRITDYLTRFLGLTLGDVDSLSWGAVEFADVSRAVEEYPVPSVSLRGFRSLTTPDESGPYVLEPTNDGDFILCVGNLEFRGSRRNMEAILYNWAWAEGHFAL